MKSQKEIYEHLLKGGKVRNRGGGSITHLQENGNLNDRWSFSSPEEWEIYEPPKPKKKLYKWAVKESSAPNWFESTNFYETEAEARKFLEGVGNEP